MQYWKEEHLSEPFFCRYFLFNLVFECAHHQYCGSESSATLALAPSITAVTLLPALCSSWFFATAAAQPFCRLPAAGQCWWEQRGSAWPGQARLRGQGSVGQEGAAASLLLHHQHTFMYNSSRQERCDEVRATLQHRVLFMTLACGDLLGFSVVLWLDFFSLTPDFPNGNTKAGFE